jgi:hypothetical protein
MNTFPTSSTQQEIEFYQVAQKRLKAIFPIAVRKQYDKKDIAKCMNSLGDMSEAEFDELKERSKDAQFPPDPITMMWYASAPLRNDDPPVVGPDGKPAWTRETVKKYMDDISGKSPVTMRLGDAAVTHAGWFTCLGMQTFAADQSVHYAATAASVGGSTWGNVGLGFVMAATVVGLIKDRHEYWETFKNAAGTWSNGGGHISESRQKLFPWKGSTSAVPLPAFSALSPKPKSMDGLGINNLKLQGVLASRLSTCPMSQICEALLHPNRAETIVEKYEQKSLKIQVSDIFDKVMEKVAGPLYQLTSLVIGADQHLVTANTPKRSLNQTVPSHPPMARTLGAAVARFGLGQPSPFAAPHPQPSSHDPLKRRRNP